MSDLENKIGNFPSVSDEVMEPKTPLRLTYNTSAGPVTVVEDENGLDSIFRIDDIMSTIMKEHYFVKPLVLTFGVKREAMEQWQWPRFLTKVDEARGGGYIPRSQK